MRWYGSIPMNAGLNRQGLDQLVLLGRSSGSQSGGSNRELLRGQAAWFLPLARQADAGSCASLILQGCRDDEIIGGLRSRVRTSMISLASSAISILALAAGMSALPWKCLKVVSVGLQCPGPIGPGSTGSGLLGSSGVKKGQADSVSRRSIEQIHPVLGMLTLPSPSSADAMTCCPPAARCAQPRSSWRQLA